MKDPFYILAPMDDVTDTLFRRIVSDCAKPDYTMTEFVNVDGLCSVGRERLMPRLANQHDTAPVIAQLWGKSPQNFEQIARELSDGTIPGFSGIDINFGCPDKSVVKNECCSALAQPHLRQKAVDIIRATKQGATLAKTPLPVSIKTRLGFSDIDYSWHELLLNEQVNMLTIHVRTTKQMSKVPAKWEAITPIVNLRNQIAPQTKIVLNGDIMNKQQGIELAQKYAVEGIMIGRGVFHDPYCFANPSPWSKMSASQRIELFKKHLTLFSSTWKNNERRFDTLKKFAKIYIAEFDGAQSLRAEVMECKSVPEVLDILHKNTVKL